VLIDLQDFERVILNLVINARDALPAGGTIEITLETRSLSKADSPSDLSAGEYVCVEVRDNGVGMTPEVQAHLFEPFFTTKQVGEGTGLGLASAYGTVRHHHGFVRVASAPGQGTSLTLFFPRAAAVLAPELSPSSAPMMTRRKSPHATILVVEDEVGVRAVTAGTLSRAGHRVLAAASPAEACAIFDRHAEEIDLLVTDVVMPEMRGPALAQRLLATRPGLPVLLVSGYNDVEGETDDPGQMMFLAKPFTPSRLVAAVS
jgi:two-component system cell cycle sensor histidine kinase/response regulator CckA